MELLKSLSEKGKLCSGCGACYNICPVQAIEMQPDIEGFLYPAINQEKCINCGKCIKTCPVLHPKYQNNAAPDCYAMMAPDDIRKGSSSGGFVTAAANWILQQGGVVYGAAWAEDWKVQHIEAETAEQFQKIRGSKYLQSETGKTFQQAKEQLKRGRYVLYTGVPCQIAALYAYLGDTPKNKLFTIDIICHGTPSHKVFHKYLEDTYDITQIERFDFRDKSFYGWSTGINVYLKNGKVIRRKHDKDAYYKAFLPCMCLRPSCSQCQASCLPRQGDFSCGDFWGLSEYKPEYNDRLGTSFVLVNNDRAQKMLSHIVPDFKLWKQVEIDAITRINKTVLHPFSPHPGRKHFFSILEQKSFAEAVDAALNHHYDIGIVGLWYGINYGSILTYYALYALLRDLGYDPVMLPKPNGMWQDIFNQPDSIAQQFIWNHCNVFVPFKRIEEYPRVNDRCNDFILGSDVVWSYNICGRESGQFFFLDWVERGHKKIAYAASMGQSLEGPTEHTMQAAYNLQQFDSLSCREEAGVHQLESIVNTGKVAHVLDPVFVCNPQIYEKIIQNVPREECGSVFGYFLNRPGASEKLIFLKKAAKLYNAEQVTISLNPSPLKNSTAFEKLYGKHARDDLRVEEWLAGIHNSKFYVGDSYHGLCFALVFHVPFAIIYLNAAENFSRSRLDSLLDIVGLKSRMLTSLDQFDKESDRILAEEIDWDDVDCRLNRWRAFSKQWLSDALHAEKEPLRPEDYVYNYQKRESGERYVRLSEEMQAMRHEMRQLKKQIDKQSGNLSQSWITQKIQGGIRCWQEHGFSYTWKHFWSKVRRKLAK